uniref:Uncharacterized protein n=1 Tax=Anguilla anguilla TaxID=7936 RepID=A0A0E9RYD4_ANGAN
MLSNITYELNPSKIISYTFPDCCQGSMYFFQCEGIKCFSVYLMTTIECESKNRSSKF